jgi:hypothetical protein
MKRHKIIVVWAEFLIKIMLVTILALGSLMLMVKIAYNLIQVMTK